MRIQRTTIRKLAIWAVGAIVTMVLIGPVGEFFIELAREQGLYNAPSRKMAAMSGWIASLVGSYAFGILAGVVMGFAAGVWIDAILRKREGDALRIQYIHTTGGEKVVAPPKPTTAPMAPHRDTRLEEALAYVRFREWGRKISDAWYEGEADLALRVQEFEQLALEGKLAVWGKSNILAFGAFEPVPAEHWKTHNVDWLVLTRGEGGRTTRRDGKGNGGGRNDLMVSKDQFEKAWPVRPASPRPQVRPALTLAACAPTGTKTHGSADLASTEVSIDIRNESPEKLKDCTVHILKVAGAVVDLPLNNGGFILPKGGTTRFHFIGRRFDSWSSPPPHMLNTKPPTELPEGREFEVEAELRSSYPHPTKVTLLVRTNSTHAYLTVQEQCAD